MEEKRNISKLIIGLILLLVGVGLLIWALTGRDAAAPSGTTSPEISQTDSDSTSETSKTSQENTVDIIFTNNGFTPNVLTVKKGSLVTVKNESDKRVQFSSDSHPTHRLNTEMNLKVLRPGEAASFTASTVGEYGFHDHIDESMTGKLKVTE